MIHILFGSTEVCIFSLFSNVFGDDIIMMSFLVIWFSICIFCRTLDGLAACKVSMLQVVFGKFYRQIKKNTIMTSSWRHSKLLGFQNLKFCETGYTLSSLQLSNLLIVWINFMEVSVRPPRTPLWCHFLSLFFQISLFCKT